MITEAQSSGIQVSDLGSHLTLHIVAAAVTMASAVFLFRTAAGAHRSRFLRQLGMSIALNVLFRIGAAVHLLLKAAVGFLAADAPTGSKMSTLAGQALPIIDSTWHGVDIMISLLASTFLFMTWDLLRRYPNEGVHRSLFTALAAVLGAGSIGVVVDLVQIQSVQRHIWGILDLLDVGAAATGLVLVGWQLNRTLGPLVKSSNHVIRSVLPSATAFLYFVWGGIQPFYIFFGESPWYDNLLLLSGVSAIFMTIILCSQTLEEREGLETTPASGHHGASKPPAQRSVGL
jgi:hypothetical protein